MKFPFVILPRSVYELLLAERAKSARLTKTIVRMKVAGGTVVGPRLQLAPREVDELDEAINSNKYADRPAVRRGLMRFKERELRKGTPRSEIERAIHEWTDRRGPSPADEDDGSGDAIELVFDDNNPSDQRLKAGITS